MTRPNRIWFTLPVLTGILLVSAIGSQQLPVGSGSSQIHRSAVAPSSPLPGNYFDHLVVIMMENEGINDICGRNPPPCNGSNTPYMSSLANSYGISQQYLSLVITSWPNYYGILGAFIPSGCSTANPGPCYPPAGSLPNPNLVDRFEAAGLHWKGSMKRQGVAADCVTGGAEPYTHEHNGFVAFQDITNNTSRCSKIVLANPGSCGGVTDCALINDLNSSSPPSFMWITPNDCNDMLHWSGCGNGCTSGGSSTCIRKGDNYLSSLVPNILNSNTFTTTRAALFITFDEGSAYCPLNNSSEDCLYAVWAGPVVKTGFSSAQLYNQYSLTKTIEVNWNLADIAANDAAATPMTEFLTHPANFIISASTPAPVRIGQTTNSTITVTSVNGFTGIVSLTETAPAGLTCGAISPSNITGSGIATVSCNASIAANYTLALTGTSGSLTHSTTAMFRFNDFSVAALPTSITVNVGTSASSTLSVRALNGFTGLVSLSTNSTSCDISPTSVTGSGNSSLSCNFASEGVTNVAVTGTNGSLSHSATVAYTIQDFSLTASPAGIDVNAGTASNSTITLTAREGFDGVVSLATNSTACTVSPTSLPGSGSSTLSCAFASASTVQVTVTGISDFLSHSVQVTFTVQDYTVVANPTSVTVNAGVAANSTVHIAALHGFAGIVTLTTNSTWCTLTPTSITGSGNATVSCTQFEAGDYTITITGTSGGLSHTATIAIKVMPGGSVGGVVLPADRLRLLSQILPVMALIAGVAIAGVIAVRSPGGRKEENTHGGHRPDHRV